MARRSFLTLWSFPNVYTDEGRRAGKGDGRELCDLLVVFGDHVILFSDKDCEYKQHEDGNVAWARWYKRSVEASARQLAGAKSWIERFPDRLFLDRQCQHPLPVKIADTEHRRIHLVAVAGGATESAVEHWMSVAEKLAGAGERHSFAVPAGPSSGSLMLCTDIEKEQHFDRPFQIGWPLGRDQYVHVFDEVTVDVVLGVLDTVPDFLRYLESKEEVFRRPGQDLIVPGGEDLLAVYLSSTRNGDAEPSFPAPGEGDSLTVLREGAWRELVADKAFRARTKANQISYHWDSLIEFQIAHLIAGSAHTIDGQYDTTQIERVLRKMAEETRLTRRALGAAVHRARKVNKRGKRYTSTVFGQPTKDRAYVIMTLPKPSDMSYEAYAEHRRYQLATYCEGCAANIPRIKEVVGIAMEPYATKTVSVDYLLVTLRDERQWAEARPDVLKRIEEKNIWRLSEMRVRRLADRELPQSQPLTEVVGQAAMRLIRKAKALLT